MAVYVLGLLCNEVPAVHNPTAMTAMKQEVGQFVLRSINLLVLFGIKRNCLRSGRSQSLYLFIRMVIKQIAVIIEAYHFCQPHTKFYTTSFCQG
jgi:hypothetical protein